MKVFYVMVLALVAGAVPSHGRTESEGTVFNKTQLHESMSNVTASSSKLEDYSFSYLVMQWPRSFCNYLNTIDRQCNQPVPARFTVHGPWPQYNPTHSVDCRGIYGRYQLFNIRLLNVALVLRLNYHWPDLTTIVDDNQIFWGTEYNKHGSCTFGKQIVYFKRTLELAEHFDHLFSTLSGIAGGIIPGYPYRSYVIRDAVHRVTNFRPRLKCITVENRMQLLEIRFCADGNRLFSCNLYSNCGNGMVYLPRP